MLLALQQHAPVVITSQHANPRCLLCRHCAPYLRALQALVLVSLAVTLATPADARQAVSVFVATVEEVPFSDEVETLGNLQATENVNLTSAVTERITHVYFEDNQRVKKGDVLVAMDDSQEQAEYAEEQSRLEEAQRQVDRIRALTRASSASEAALDEQERELNTAKARIVAIESRINERKITAPFDGIVGFRNISVGALAQPGMVITTIDDDSKMKLDFAVPEVFLSSLRKGLAVVGRTSAYPQRAFNGEITSIDSRIDPITRSVKARAVLANDEGLLKGGMLMRVKLSKNPRQTLIIPEEAIITVGSRNTVMLVEDGEPARVRQQDVTTGARRKGIVEIITGLNAGDKVVTHGTLKVRDGSAVTIAAIERDNESLTELLQQKAEATSP